MIRRRTDRPTEPEQTEGRGVLLWAAGAAVAWLALALAIIR